MVGDTRFQVTTGQTVQEVERQLVLATVQDCGGNISLAAKVLGLSRRTIYNRIERAPPQGVRPRCDASLA